MKAMQQRRCGVTGIWGALSLCGASFVPALASPPSGSNSGGKSLVTPQVRQNLLEDRFREVSRFADLPNALRLGLVQQIHTTEIADVGKPWSGSAPAKRLPNNRLLFGAFNEKYAAIGLESQGGRYSRFVHVFRLSPEGKRAALLGTAWPDHTIVSLETLRRAERKKPMAFWVYR